MKISLNWLKDYIDLPESVEKISQTLTATGLEVEGLESFEEIEGGLEGVVIGEVMSCEKHQDADKLKKTTVDIGGDELIPIVCGAPNVEAGQKVIVATVNSTLFPLNGEAFKIKKAKIRGEVSQGMICAEDEIGLGQSHDGIMILDTTLPNGTPAAEYFGLESDTIIEIGLTPNRADATSHFGTARDLKAAFLRETKVLDTSNFSIDNRDNQINVVVENSVACPRYSGLTISGVEVKESPKWLKNRLKSIALTPINNIVDSTNYVLHSIGQPMHAFDADKIKGKKVVVKTLPEGTPFITLDEKERKLKSHDLMICDEKEGMCIAGVFGGIHSGVSNQTKNIFLESAYFSADFVRKTAMVHGLKTDASFRYERGTDPKNTVTALKYCALLIKEIAGGKISSDIIDIYENPIEDVDIEIKYKNINRLIGIEIPKERIHEILTYLDIVISKQTENGFDCKVPTYRVDVTREADIIEEILRVYGYDNIELEESYGAGTLAAFPKPDKDKVQERTSHLLASNGFNEIITNSLTNPKYIEGFDNWDSNSNVEILNKLSEELGIMRQTLIFSGLESLKYNINRKQKNIKFFEFGRSYHINNDKYSEKQYLSLFLSGNKNDENWNFTNAETDFHELASMVYKVLNKFLIKEINSTPTINPVFQYGLDLEDNGKKLVSLGLLKNEILKKGEVSQPVFYAEFDWKKILKYSNKKFSYQSVSKFPEVKRDLSLVIDKKTTFDQIIKLAKQENRKLIKKINVFSIYEGENIGKDKKSYALSFILQDEFKTLTDKQIDKTMNSLIGNFEKNLNAIIRK
jgi:phenylalanyl-tRNA synthetase beta chain